MLAQALLNSAEHDPSWAVRAAAVEKLGDIARELRKLGYKSRWGQLKFWFQEDEEPWRDTGEEYRAFFWSVIERATRDLAWQVRKRAVETIADAVEFGDQVPYNWITASAEDGSEIVKIAATKILMNALFGRGSVISERNYKLQQLLQDGLVPEEAVRAADEHATATKEEDWERAVIHAIIHRSHHESAMTRRQALQTLANVISNARLKGDNQAILAMLAGLEDNDVLVKTAAVQSLRKTALNSDARVVKGLIDTALYDTEWQTRKAAVEALEVRRMLVCACDRHLRSDWHCLLDFCLRVSFETVKVCQRYGRSARVSCLRENAKSDSRIQRICNARARKHMAYRRSQCRVTSR